MWQKPADGYSGMVVANGLAYVGTNPGSKAGLRAFDAKTGQLRWTTKFASNDDFDASSPSYANGKVYMAAQKDYGFHLHAVNAVTGKELWTAVVPDPANIYRFEEPVIANGLVFTARNAFDANTGALRWRIRYPDRPHGCSAIDVVQQPFSLGGPLMTVSNGVLYVSTGNPAGRYDLKAVDAATGRVLRTIANAGRYNEIGVANGMVYMSPNPPPGADVAAAFAP